MSGGAFTAAEAATIARVPVSTLRYWIRTGLVEPTVSMVRPIMFDFLDLRDLRIIVGLRDRTSTQTIRRAIGWLRSHTDQHRLVDHVLVVDGAGEVVWLPGDDASAVEASGHGQTVLLELDDVWNELGAEVRDGEVVALHPIEEVAINPNIHGGAPVVEGTRVPTALIAELVGDGLTPAEVVKLYPTVPLEAIEPVVEWQNGPVVAA